MAKMYALHQIILEDDKVVPRHTVFDATPAQAKQFDALKAARPATAEEVAEAKEAAAKADGSAFAEGPSPNDPSPADNLKPASGAPGDPQSPPKGK
ncbi:hypothetical protein [Aquamicrobium zhengzhouense]|uniref:Uncharacterized protein n=1 Tax=Aquamicrobium zhengzhouense TaxID=2781738 RepID=A0ABS0S9Q6_9HYPH|nr:hypothetical protein [Aquamicrobium zhengzhouense]MBI1620014.1 hypothetical protein [Aquamicrobium zhengzhouense]